MKIKTIYDPPPIPFRNFDWCAYDDETYSGEEGEPIGFGETEEDAIDDLLLELLYRDDRESKRHESISV